MQKRIIILLFLFCFGSSLFAQNNDVLTNQENNPDTNYITDYRYQLQVKAIGLTRQAEFRLFNKQEPHSIDFSTNSPFSFGFGIDYSWISLDYTQTIKGFEFTDPRKGKSESQAFRLRLVGKKIGASVFIRKTRGYNLENIESWVPDWFENNEKYPFVSDLETRILAFSGYYTFNYKKYSNAAALRFNARQIKSAGSPVVGVITSIERINSPTPMISSDSLAKKFLNISKVEYVKLGLTAGYMHTFAIKKRFYIHAAVIQGVLYSVGEGKYHDFNEVDDIDAWGISIYLRLAMGYNGQKWFTGILFVNDIFANDVSSELFSTSLYNYFKLSVGYRFPVKRQAWLRKFYL